MTADNEEELYIPLEGNGTLFAEGRSYPMKRGVLIRVGAAAKLSQILCLSEH
jgi:hypothetical protein